MDDSAFPPPFGPRKRGQFSDAWAKPDAKMQARETKKNFI
jgi:hypothetical protein